MTTKYTPIHLSEAVRLGLKASDGSPLVAQTPMLPVAKLVVPPLAFGHTDPAAVGPVQQMHMAWSATGEANVGPFPAYVIRDAVVHTLWGIVTSGEYLFRDTLYHVPVHLLPEAGDTGDGSFALPDLPCTNKYISAVHLLAGNLDNYYHWLIDVVSRIETARYGRRLARSLQAGPLLVPGPWRNLEPRPLAAYQTASLDLLIHPAAARRPMAPNEAVAVKYLRYVPNLSNAGFAPHPGVLRVFDELRDTVLKDRVTWPNNRKLYLSRQDATARPMRNETAIIALMRKAGFEIIVPGSISFAEQIALFDQASHVVAPHGAGLTNILFCRPGTVVCELQMDAQIHWALRCLAAIRGLTYGCLVGRADQPWNEWPDLNSWTAPEPALAELVNTLFK